MSDPNVIAQLPLRVYTPIKDLQYNESVADDIRELPDFLNVNIGEMKDLAPVVCQVHEPHESLRLVPWVKPTVAKVPGAAPGDPPIREEIQRGVWHWVNGRWLPLVPEYETLEDIEDEVLLALPTIGDHNDAVIADQAATESLKGEVSDLYDECVDLNAETLVTLARTRQLAINQNFLHGTAQAIIPPSQGVIIPEGEGSVAAHAHIKFVADDGEWATEQVAMTHRYRTFCLPAFIMGGGRELTPAKPVAPGGTGGIPMTYYPSYAQWVYYRRVWNWWNVTGAGTTRYPDIVFPEYTERDWAINFGYYFSANGAAYRDPVVLIEFAWDEPAGDTHPNVWSDPLVRIQYTMVAGAPDPMEHYVTGFKVWFSNLDYSTWPAAPNGPANTERKLKFHWTAYGKRRIPPEIWT